MPHIKLDTGFYMFPNEFWDKCDTGDREKLRDLVIEQFDLPHLGLELPLDESVVEYMIESYGKEVMTSEAIECVKDAMRELIWKIEHRNFS